MNDLSYFKKITFRYFEAVWSSDGVTQNPSISGRALPPSQDISKSQSSITRGQCIGTNLTLPGSIPMLIGIWHMYVDVRPVNCPKAPLQLDNIRWRIDIQICKEI